MADNTGVTVANRDSPLPLISVDAPTPTEEPKPSSRRGVLKKSLSAEKLRDRLEGLQQRPQAEASRSLQDRLFTKYDATLSLSLVA